MLFRSKTALMNEAKKVIPTIGSNIVYYDIETEKFSSGSWSKTNDGATIMFQYPSGTSQSTTFTVVHMKDGGTLEAPSISKDVNGITITVSQTSPFAIAWRVSSASSSGGSSSDDGSYNFWSIVEQRIKNADSGDTVKIIAKGYDRMPWTVMQALRNNKINLIIECNGGDNNTIQIGSASGREEV